MFNAKPKTAGGGIAALASGEIEGTLSMLQQNKYAVPALPAIPSPENPRRLARVVAIGGKLFATAPFVSEGRA